MEKSNLITILTLFFVCSFFNVSAGIYFPTADSTNQKIIEFTHKTKNKKTYSFAKGEKVVIKRKGNLATIVGEIEGFTKHGIIIRGEEIKIEDIKSIRRKSILAFILSQLSSISIILGLSGILLLILTVVGLSSMLTTTTGLFALLILFFWGAVIIGTIVFLMLLFLGLGLILELASITRKRTNKFFSLKRWTARIVTRKLAKMRK